MSFRPFIPRDHGTTAEITSRAYAQVGGPKKATVVLGLAETRVYDLSHPGDDKPRVSFDQARQLSKAGATAFAEALAAEAGGYFAPGEPPQESALEILMREPAAQADLMNRVLGHMASDKDLAGDPKVLREVDTLVALFVALRRRLSP